MNLQKIEKKLNSLKAFLLARGAEVLLPTNEWEVLRFRAGESTSVIYKTAKGGLTLTGQAQIAIEAFFQQKSWRATPKKKATRTKKKGPNRIRDLIARDGDNCFLCLKPLGDDITEEHLLALTNGGSNHIANLALAHSKCNLLMHHLPLMEKIRMRERVLINQPNAATSPLPAIHPHNCKCESETTGVLL